MAKKIKKVVVGLKCSETGLINYTIYKPNNVQGKLSVKKYSPTLKKHTVHDEVKIG